VSAVSRDLSEDELLFFFSVKKKKAPDGSLRSILRYSIQVSGHTLPFISNERKERPVYYFLGL